MLADLIRRNRILKRLGSDEAATLVPALEPVELEFKETLQEQGQPIRYIYFPASGVVSLITELRAGQAVETGTVGREGLTGLPALLGEMDAPWRGICQIPGSALRIPVDRLRVLVDNGHTLRLVVMRYTSALMAMLAQSAACNGAHSVEERMCRWLLMTHDRVEADEFALTQEFLAQMLGVRRPTVSLAGGVLQRAGYISYVRGRISVLDRAGLEGAACECYAYVKQQFDAALGKDTSG